jgi:Ca2+-binding EF-hand superfamily protein
MKQKNTQKKLQKNSNYAQYDMDNDGTVSDEELEHMKEIKLLENDLRKNRAQRRMATFTLAGMGLFTAMMFVPFITIERIEALSDISNLFYISGAGIVGAYMGATAWMSRK